MTADLRQVRSVLIVLTAVCVVGDYPQSVTAGVARSKQVLPIAAVDANPAIPSVKKTLGYDWATQITSHTSMEKYLRALAKAAPDRCRLVRYGDSYEGRGLYYLVITSPENFARLEEIRQSVQKLSDPRTTTLADAGSLIANLPAVVMLAASVHGNELSSTESMLLTAYHLLADRRPETEAILQRLVVLIDPLQNPDGRERYVNVYQESRGSFVNSHPLSMEHTERWPGGRFNHYLFDMNRDWFLQSQRETQQKVRAYLHWMPQIYVDAHEMGRNSTYFFVPPTDPVNPFMLPKQHQWLAELGQHQAAWFDRHGFAYTTRELFDAFFPGYGSEWPTLHGGLGILWEQAGTRGLIVDRDDETKLTYQDAIEHHYISSLAVLEIAAERREALLQDYYESRSRSVQLGNEGPVKSYFLPLQPRPNRTVRLATLLQRNGVEIRRVAEDLTITATDANSDEKGEKVIPRGSLQISVAQPASRLVRAILDRRVEMDEEFVKRQLQRKEDDLPDQIYDVTAWSLPMAFDVPCLATEETTVEQPVWDAGPEPVWDELPEAQVAYLVRPTDGALQALSQWLQRGLRVHVTDEPFALSEQKFPAGTLIVKRQENRTNLLPLIRQARKKYQLDVTATDTGYVTEGAHFGGPYVKWIRPPKIVLAMDRPAAYSVGHTWHLLDQELHYPTTRVSLTHLAALDLDDFNVLVLPDGSYEAAGQLDRDFAGRLRHWVREGGTLVLVAGAAVWAADNRIGLISLRRVAKSSDESRSGDAPPTSEIDVRHDSSKKWPDEVPGAFLRGNVFDQHWLSFGCAKTMNVFFQGNIFFEPVPKDAGRNLMQFANQEDVLASGFCWPETRQLLAGKTYLAYFPVGEGHIVAFASDPNFRAMYPSLQRLFLNACLFGPGH